MRDSVRAFVALELSPEIKQAIAEYLQPLRKLSDKVRWVKPENIHLTLKFLGDTPTKQIEAISGTLEEISHHYAPISVEIAGAGSFPNSRRPRVLWIGLDDPSGEISAFASEVDRQLQAFGFAREKREFSPHLTLGRVKDGNIREVLDFLRDNPWPPARVKLAACTFMKSDLQRSGAVYSPLAVIPFGTGGAMD